MLYGYSKYHDMGRVNLYHSNLLFAHGWYTPTVYQHVCIPHCRIGQLTTDQYIRAHSPFCGYSMGPRSTGLSRMIWVTHIHWCLHHQGEGHS